MAVTRPPHVQRCTHRAVFGSGVHARSWQCLVQDPHPDGGGHQYGIDAEEFGRVLPEQGVPWLVGTLRTVAATLRHERRRVRDLSAVAAQLAALAAGPGRPPVSATTAAWVRDNHPTAAAALDLDGPWHLPEGRP